VREQLCTDHEQPDKHHVARAALRAQVRDDEEEGALEAVRLNRRGGAAAGALDFEEVAILRARFDRIGNERTVSGAAVQRLPSVITTGAGTHSRASVV
jgi:purine nucleoside permease